MIPAVRRSLARALLREGRMLRQNQLSQHRAVVAAEEPLLAGAALAGGSPGSPRRRISSAMLSPGFQAPAMFDICNTVNPNSGGILLLRDGDDHRSQFAEAQKTAKLAQMKQAHLLMAKKKEKMKTKNTTTTTTTTPDRYQEFVRNYFVQQGWSICPETFGKRGNRRNYSHRKLRRVLPALVDDSNTNKPTGPFDLLRTFKYQNAFHRNTAVSSTTTPASDETRPTTPMPMTPTTTNVTLRQQKQHDDGNKNIIAARVVTGFAGQQQAANTAPPGASDSEQENLFVYNIVVANNTQKPVRLLGHRIEFFGSSAEDLRFAARGGSNAAADSFSNAHSLLKSSYIPGVNKNFPVIYPGEHYVCGSTVAFPEGLENLSFGGSLDFAQEGLRDPAFEELDFESKWEQLRSLSANFERDTVTQKKRGNGFSLFLPETRFSCEVVADMQKLTEKFARNRVSNEGVIIC